MTEDLNVKQQSSSQLIRGKKKLVKEDVKTTKSEPIFVKRETEVTDLATPKNEVTIFKRQKTAVDENGNITYSKDLSDEQIENLQKLQKAKEYFDTEDGKKMAESLLNQNVDISKGQRKFLKKKGIDADAFIQEWNRRNPDSPNNKNYNKEEADDAKNEMAAYARGFLDDQDVKMNKPKQEKLGFVKGLFKLKEKEKVTKDTTYSEQGLKIKHHSSTEERDSRIESDVTDDVARNGEEYLDAFSNNKDGKRKKTFSETDENGNKITYKVRYNKDGSVKKVTAKGKSIGKLKVKKERDGDITVKGDLQAKTMYTSASGQSIQVKQKEIYQQNEVTEVTREYLQQDTKIINKTKVIKEDCPDPVVSDSDKYHGTYVSDVPARSYVFKDKSGKEHPALDGATIRDIAEKNGMDYLLDGFCNNPASAKYEVSTEPFRGNLNQQNAKYITGVFIHANTIVTHNGPNGREITEKTADYDGLINFINRAYARDQEVQKYTGSQTLNQILPYIKLEIDEYNKNCKNLKHSPNSNNTPIDISKLPDWFRNMKNAVQLVVK